MSRKVRPPRSMKVMGQRYAIEVIDGLEIKAEYVYGHEGEEGHLTLLGHCESDDNNISLNENQGEDRMRETVIHEALHAVFDSTRMTRNETVDGALQEEIVGRLSPVLLLWLRDNKALVAYLQRRA